MGDRYVYVQQTEGRLYKVSAGSGGGGGGGGSSDGTGCAVWILAGFLCLIGSTAYACF